MEDVFRDIRAVWITSFWGWGPETWGTVGFTAPKRRETVVGKTPDPFIMVVYVTKTAKTLDPFIRGKVAGFLVVSHVAGHRDDFTAPEHHTRDAGKWVYSLKAVRAFTFVPEFSITIDQLDPSIASRARAVAAFGEELKPPQVDALRRLPYREVTVFGGPPIAGDIVVPGKAAIGVKAGPVNRSGYFVPGEPVDTPKELYALRLSGEASTFLGVPAKGRVIFKIGLSMSPQTRLEMFRKMIPQGAFRWGLHRTTLRDGHERYQRYESAEHGEWEIKKLLGKHGKWLGGEFYAATPDAFENAWMAGRTAALAHQASLGTTP